MVRKVVFVTADLVTKTSFVLFFASFKYLNIYPFSNEVEILCFELKEVPGWGIFSLFFFFHLKEVYMQMS